MPSVDDWRYEVANGDTLLGFSEWQAHKAEADGISPGPFVITAECYSDDRVIEFNFDAVAWFQQASEGDILRLSNEGWGHGYAADEVARFFSDTTTSRLFSYIGILQGADKNCGFECVVELPEAIAWLKGNRPDVVARISDLTWSD